MIEFVGWFGGLLLTFCGVPMALQSYKEGHSKGINMLFLQMWLWGEIALLVYILFQPILMLPLLVNYLFNIILVLIILKYKIYPRYNDLDI